MLLAVVTQIPNKNESLSILIECSQVTPTGTLRCLDLLRELRLQVIDYLAEERVFTVQQPVEILFVYDASNVLSKSLLDQLRMISDESTESINVRLVATDSSAYYVQKNVGYQNSLGTVNVFVDRDVIPDPGWLERLLEPFASPSVHVVCGNTYIEPRGLLGKAFALSWFHPKHDPAPALLERSIKFHANNVAMRRAATEDPPFPRLQGDVRGSCAALAVELRDSGIDIWHSHGAGASHPIPLGPLDFLLRALVHGRDLIILSRYLKQSKTPVDDKISHIWLWIISVFRFPSAVKKRFRLVGISFFELPVILSICAIYYGFVISGAILTCLHTPTMLRYINLPGQPRYDG